MLNFSIASQGIKIKGQKSSSEGLIIFNNS